jgi:hypothetical protein
MEKILNFGYWILSKAKELTKKFIAFGTVGYNKFKNWLDDQYKLRVRWRDAQPYLLELEVVVPSLQKKLNRVSQMAFDWANKNHELVIENQGMNQENSLLLTENMQLRVTIEEYKKGKKIDIYKQQKEKEEEPTNGNGKIPECFRQYNEASEKCQKCNWGTNCDMRHQNDLKLEEMKQKSVIKVPDKKTVRINPDIIPTAKVMGEK